MSQIYIVYSILGPFIYLIEKVKILSFLIFFFGITNVYGMEKLSQINCSEVSEEYAGQLSQLIERGEYDKIYYIANLWEQSCGLTEPVFRVKALLKIHHNTFPGQLEYQNMLNQAIAFEIRDGLPDNPQQRREYFELHAAYFGYVQPGHRFDIQTARWAAELKLTTPAGSIAYLFLQLYEGQTEVFFNALREGQLHETTLARDYQAKVDENLDLVEFNLGVNTGLWLPTGNLGKIGPKPSVGIVLGVKTKNSYIDGVFEVRFGKTRQDVLINLRDTIVATRNFQGGYVGLEFTRILARGQRGAFEVFAGLGYDIIEIIEDEQSPQGITLGSFAAHLGLGYRFHFRNHSWLSIKPGYYFINHRNHSGSSLSGNAINIRFTFGLSENSRKSNNLKRLGVGQWW